MSVAYVDTSVLTAVVFDEPGAAAYARRLDEFSRLISSNLLEAELRAAFARENLLYPERAVAGIEWILPRRPLAPEFATVLGTGYLRGADLWHVATALYVSPRPGSLWFATLDARQGTVAEALGFRVPGEAGTDRNDRRPRLTPRSPLLRVGHPQCPRRHRAPDESGQQHHRQHVGQRLHELHRHLADDGQLHALQPDGHRVQEAEDTGRRASPAPGATCRR